MRINKKGLLYKILSVARFLVAKVCYRTSFSFCGLGMIGARSYFYIEGNGSIVFGNKVILSDMVEVQSSGDLVVGSNCIVNRNSRIVCFDKIEIGNNVAIAQFVSILDHDHDFEVRDGQMVLDGYKSQPIKIGNNVWIGDKCTVLRGVTIGDNVIVAAHTLVNKDVPSNSIVAGTPCEVVKNLS